MSKSLFLVHCLEHHLSCSHHHRIVFDGNILSCPLPIPPSPSVCVGVLRELAMFWWDLSIWVKSLLLSFYMNICPTFDECAFGFLFAVTLAEQDLAQLGDGWSSVCDHSVLVSDWGSRAGPGSASARSSFLLHRQALLCHKKVLPAVPQEMNTSMPERSGDGG